MNCLTRLILAMLFFMTSIEGHALNDIDLTSEEIISAINLYQDDWKIAEIDGRIYVNPSSIVLQEDQNILLVDPFEVQIPSLFWDSYGIYMHAEMCMDVWFSWECCKCNHYNSKNFNTCQNCKRRRCDK